MDYLKLNGETYPVYFGGAARQRLLEELDSKVLAAVTLKLIKTKDSKTPKVTDKELFTVFIPVVKWGIWGGYRFDDQKKPPFDNDDLADWLWSDNMAAGFTALEHYFRSTQQNGEGEKQDAVTEKK